MVILPCAEVPQRGQVQELGEIIPHLRQGANFQVFLGRLAVHSLRLRFHVRE